MMQGTFIAKKKDGTVYYRSSFTYKNKHISLGSYETEAEAHNAYLRAACIVSDTSFTLTDYSPDDILTFEKWVILINFRDNNMYFKNPIYLRPKYFEYYLDNDPFAPLKFDADDLFFYSTHKIMRRGGHLFVADYGMQLNILNRYGIKNFAVLGKDYVFVNGDTSDYRYMNIKIINRYYGVSSYANKTGKTCYRSKIHIRGDYVIGNYQTETDAAIAYNKAADILNKKGVSITFNRNYIENMDTAQYLDIYETLPVSKKISDFKLSSDL